MAKLSWTVDNAGMLREATPESSLGGVAEKGESVAWRPVALGAIVTVFTLVLLYAGYFFYRAP